MINNDTGFQLNLFDAEKVMSATKHDNKVEKYHDFNFQYSHKNSFQILSVDGESDDVSMLL